MAVVIQDSVRKNLDSVVVMISVEKMILVVEVTSAEKTILVVEVTSAEKTILVVEVTSGVKTTAEETTVEETTAEETTAEETTAEETMEILITMISSKTPVIFWKTSMRQLRTLNLHGV